MLESLHLDSRCTLELLGYCQVSLLLSLSLVCQSNPEHTPNQLINQITKSHTNLSHLCLSIKNMSEKLEIVVSETKQ